MLLRSVPRPGVRSRRTLSLYEPNPSAAGSEAVAWASDSLIDGRKCPTPRGKVSGYGVMTGSLPGPACKHTLVSLMGPLHHSLKSVAIVGRAAQSALKI